MYRRRQAGPRYSTHTIINNVTG